MPSADENRQATTLDRRRLIIDTVERHMGSASAPALAELDRRLDEPQWMITGADIDSLVSSALLSAASGGKWRIGVVIIRSRDIRVHPNLVRLADAVLRDDVYGVDLYSPLFPSISNHPLLFGTTDRKPQNKDVRYLFHEYDMQVVEHLQVKRAINLSGWAKIAAIRGSEDPRSRYYKYPLGTAQLMLACLEVLGRAPRLYDRQYLPWMIANCDGGLKTIRQYPWNVEAWWSALAAVAGPASLSESIYQVATQQRPTEFVDVDRRLRYDYPELATSLRGDWNIAGESLAKMLLASRLLSELSGWDNPFERPHEVDAWAPEVATGGILSMRGLGSMDLDDIKLHLRSAKLAAHVNFSEFRERGVGLGWLLPLADPTTEARLGSTPVDLNTSLADDDEDDAAAGLVEPEAPGDVQEALV